METISGTHRREQSDGMDQFILWRTQLVVYMAFSLPAGR